MGANLVCCSVQGRILRPGTLSARMEPVDVALQARWVSGRDLAHLVALRAADLPVSRHVLHMSQAMLAQPVRDHAGAQARRGACCGTAKGRGGAVAAFAGTGREEVSGAQDRKSTRLNSSHVKSSYAVFCLKKKSCVGPGPTARGSK